MVINDYIRARSLFADTQVQVFRKGKIVLKYERYEMSLFQSVIFLDI